MTPGTGLYVSLDQQRPELMFKIFARSFGSRPSLKVEGHPLANRRSIIKYSLANHRSLIKHPKASNRSVMMSYRLKHIQVVKCKSFFLSYTLETMLNSLCYWLGTSQSSTLSPPHASTHIQQPTHSPAFQSTIPITSIKRPIRNC